MKIYPLPSCGALKSAGTIYLIHLFPSKVTRLTRRCGIKTSLKGISIIEVLMVIAIIGVLAGASVGTYLYFKKGANFNLSAQQVANLIRQAQNKAVAIESDDAWGINITNQQAIIFKGTNFSGRNQAFDEKTVLTEITTVSGSSQFIFNKFTGFPINPNSLTVGNGSSSKTIQVNEKGFVNF